MTSPLTQAFRDLHTASGGFIMPNAWDVGSALVLADAGFAAIATTSAGIAFSLGRPDYHVARPDLAVSREAMLERMAEIVRAVRLPVNGDLEAGYGDSPEAVAETVRMAAAAGLAGGNIEDKIPLAEGLYDEALAVERIAAAREAAPGFVLTARCDAMAASPDGLAEVIRRSNLYRAAGADCLFTPGVSDLPTVATLAAEIDGPLNIVMGLGDAEGDARALIAAGVQRVSLGGSIARSAMGLVQRAAAELRDRGTIRFATDQAPQGSLNTLFARMRT